MKQLYLYLIVFSILTSCNKEEKNNQYKAEIKAVLLHKSSTEPLSEINGSYYDYDGEFINRYRVELVNKDEFFHCYENEELLKIEIIGNIPNAKIEFEREGLNKVILENVNIEGEFIIHHASIYEDGAFSSGKLNIFSNDSIIKSIKMNVDGCH
jgi:hypothetical protein